MYLLDVEQSQGVATINLAGAFSSLSAERQFIARMAVVNTLTELGEIRYVNLLIDGAEEPLYWYSFAGGLGSAASADVALPSAGTSGAQTGRLGLPTGTMMRTEDVDSEYMRFTSLVDRIGGASGTADAGKWTPETITRYATLYFASENGGMLMPEVWEIEMGMTDYIMPVIEALIRGPNDTLRLQRTLPAEAELRSASVDLWMGTAYVVVDFRSGILELIERSQLDPSIVYASVAYTLLGFVPGAQAVRFQVEGVDYAVFGEYPTERTESTLSSETDIAPRSIYPYIREDFSVDIGRDIVVYVPLADGRIRAERKTMTQTGAARPRSWLNALLEEARGDALEDLLTLPFPEALREEDILGLAINGETILVNLSREASEGFTGADRLEERAWIYALVNTLCGIPGIKSVRFTVEGTPVDTLGGNIWLREALLPNPGLVAK